MSTAADTDADATAGVDPERVASALSAAEFVRAYARPTGDALAAAGLLARTLRDRGTPFQVRTTRERVAPDGDGRAVTLGWAAPDATAIAPGDRPVSAAAAAVVDALGAEPDPLTGLAGVAAAGAVPGDDGSGGLLEAAERRGLVERRPGLAVPTDDLADGLAHSTLLRAPYSGDTDATRELIADLGIGPEPTEDDRRRLASAVALDATGERDAPERSVGAVERALRPYATPTGPFATLGGHADVLSALARERPGLGVSLALGADVADAARSVWREHASRAHGLLDDPTTGRYDGALVYRVETEPGDASALATAARLVRDFRSPEPVALVVSDDAAAAAGDGAADVTAALRAGVEGAGGDGDDPDGYDVVGDARAGDARFSGGDVQAFVGAFREALR
ncbi:exonuclease RecJ [Halobaculum sp. EA56]|uniref:exonuclease RecJ n=1 Tax=Halobaculum sp. EA56 TaxID=3421648 RepID=UPI003EBEB5F5